MPAERSDSKPKQKSPELRFACPFCGRDFGSDVMGLAVHIGRMHDPPRK